MKQIKNAVLILLTSLALFSCGGGYTLTGKIDGTQATEAYLMMGETIDTVLMEEGVFVFKGKLEEPTMAQLVVDRQSVEIMMENNEMTIEGAVGTSQLPTLREAEITGSESQAAYYEYVREIGKHKNSREAFFSYIKEFSASHPDSYFTPYVLSIIAPALPAEETKALIAALAPEVGKSKVSMKMLEDIALAEATKIGAIAPDFTLNDVDGKPVKLSDVYAGSKYLLIDFWASWCGPCRSENPNVVTSYKAYHDKGFEIIGVSLDEKRDEWVKAIGEDELTWLHVLDLKGEETQVAATYAVHSIPTNFLVDNTGKIVARNLRGAELGKKLSELLD